MGTRPEGRLFMKNTSRAAATASSPQEKTGRLMNFCTARLYLLYIAL